MKKSNKQSKKVKTILLGTGIPLLFIAFGLCICFNTLTYIAPSYIAIGIFFITLFGAYLIGSWAAIIALETLGSELKFREREKTKSAKK